MKKKERAVIVKLNDNTYRDENDPIVSVDLKYEDGSGQGTKGYRGNSYNNFMKNMMNVLEIEEKNQMIGKPVLACTEMDRLLAIGNQLGNKWIDLKKVSELIEGDIISYLEEKERIEAEQEREI